MSNNLKENQCLVIEMSFNEMLIVNGGSQQTYSAGYEAGAYIRKVLDGVGVLSALRTLASVF